MCLALASSLDVMQVTQPGRICYETLHVSCAWQAFSHAELTCRVRGGTCRVRARARDALRIKRKCQRGPVTTAAVPKKML